MPCPFEGDSVNPCYTGEDLMAVSGPCSSDARGMVCGPAAGYTTLVNNFGGLEQLDNFEPIHATFTINTTPGGMPPEEVRREWNGVTLPVRDCFEESEGTVQISPADAIISLLMHGKMDAAQWFYNIGIPLEAMGAKWQFRDDEGEVKEIEDLISSVEFYSRFVPDAIRKAIDEAR
jgi:hypothetical protein